MVAEIDRRYLSTRPSKALVRLVSHLFFQGRYVTTKYRWLNHFILTELEILKRLPRIKDVEKPIFIIGIGRSGSTILGKVLSMHKMIGFLNEPKAIWFVIDRRDDINGHFQLGDACYRFSEDDATPQKKEYANRIFGFYSAITGSKRILDKNPEILFRIPYVKELFPDARFLLLIRDGWDTVNSIVNWSRRERVNRNGYLADWWGLNRRKWKLMIEQLVPEEPLFNYCKDEIRLFTREEDMAAVEWIISMQEGLRCIERWPDSVLAIYYEDLIQSPIRELNKVIAFCELDPDDVFVSYAKETLILNKRYSILPISPSIQNAFEVTMHALNYRCDK